MLKGYGVQLYNNHVEKDIQNYNLNYDFYISKVLEIITELNQKNQLTLF